LDLAVAELLRETLLQGFEVLSQPRSHHDAIDIDGLALPAIARSGADGTEEAVPCEHPHS
jgi:hypothetical protein